MIYGIEETTDLRSPETKIKKFASKLRAIKWSENSGGLAWEGSAKKGIPVSQQNWHHRYRYVYSMPLGWRSPSKKKLSETARLYSTGTYYTTMNDILATSIRNDGEAIGSKK